MNICKPPEPLYLSGNNAKNWREFKEQLQWFLAGTESNEKSDAVKIGIMLSHAGKEAREVYKTLAWAADGDKDKFDRVVEAFERFCSPQKNMVHTSYNLNVTRVYHACVDHAMHTLFCYTRVLSCVFISYTTNT